MRFATCMAMGALVCATALHAQQPEIRRASAPPPAAAPAARPRIGYAAAPTPPEAPVQSQYPQQQQQYYYSDQGYYISGAPYLVLWDGSVLVNFGNGDERVLRQCSSSRNTAPADPYARDALGRIPEPPGIAALRPGARGQLSGTRPGRSSEGCYRADGRGGMQMISGSY